MTPKQSLTTAVLLTLLGLLAYGCGPKKRIETLPLPDPAKTVALAPAPTATPAPKPQVIRTHQVVKGDTLWDIASSPNTYDDALLWPYLYKANRDQIKDPDLIYPDQYLNLLPPTLEEAQEAQRDAIATPKYVPHTTPRETLPVDYF